MAHGCLTSTQNRTPARETFAMPIGVPFVRRHAETGAKK
jgi:hypothetical protein